MEAQKPRQTGRALQFLSAWTTTLHAQGYSSGVYGSSSSGVTDLAHQDGSGKYACQTSSSTRCRTARPARTILCFAMANGPITIGYAIQRQYRADPWRCHNPDRPGYLDVVQPRSPSPSPVTATYPAGATATWYKGQAFDACSAPSLKAVKASGRSPYRAIGVYIGRVNLACSQPRLTANWVTAVSAQKWRLLPVYVGRQPQCFRKNGQVEAVKAATSEDQPFRGGE